MRCTRCAADLPDGARFCPACGAPRRLVCQRCGEIAPAGAHFCAACGSALAAPAATAPAPADPGLPAAPAERRQLSVMFCDLVGSTALSARLDPEDLRALMSRYQRTVADTVQRQGGFVARYMGDGLLVYFGWPRADEADAERAVRAGLAAIEAVRGLATPAAGLSARVGIATGLAVVGDLIGEGAAAEQAIVGEAPNLAARLQSAAEPGTVVIDAATHALIGTMFECRSLQPLHLKGWPAPVPAWIVEAAATLQSRSEALYRRALSPLIGREDELALLLRRWRAAVAGEGQAMLISGEPGIGKSRLMAELERLVASEPHEDWRYFCSPYQQDTPLYPVTVRWEREAGFARGDSPERRLHKLRAVHEADTSAEDFALLADLLNLPAEGRLKLDLSPQRQRERTFALLLRVLAARAARRPVLMVLEDAHWADATTIELIDHVIRELPNLRVLLVMSFRPEYRAPWIGQAGVTLVTLSRLTRRQSAALAAQVTLDLALPPPLIERVVAQTDGVPLFIEELTRTLLDRGDASDGALSVPTTLQASLLARLDRIPAAKQVAQIAAVIGRETPQFLLAEAAGLPEPVVHAGLAALVESGLMFRRGVAPDVTYVFKHALVQEAAYESLLRSRRAEIHGAIAAALAHDPETGADAAATIGRHFAQAGQLEPAAIWYRRAGQRSAERSAIVETKAQLQRGLRLAGEMPDNSARRRLEAELELTLGRMLLDTVGMGDRDAGEAFERSAALCRHIDAPDIVARALWGRFTVATARGNPREGARIGMQLMALAPGNPRIELVARLMLGVADVWSARPDRARDHLQAVMSEVDRDPDIRLDLPGIAEPDAFAAAFLSLALGVLGHVEQAVGQALDAVRRANPLLNSFATILSTVCRTACCVMNDALLSTWARDLVNIAEQRGFPYWEATGTIYLGWLTKGEGGLERGLAALDAAIGPMDRLGATVNLPFFLSMRADRLALLGRHDEALKTLDRALELGTRTGEAYALAEIHRQKGDVLLHTDRTAGESQLRTALAVARQQQARLWELRAALSLARHLIATGRRLEAHAMLAPVCDWFDPATTLPTLIEARGLLGQAC